MLRSKKGQSTVEYLILVAGVIAILLVFVGNSGSPFRKALNSTYDSATNGMQNMAGRLANSHCTPDADGNGCP